LAVAATIFKNEQRQWGGQIGRGVKDERGGRRIWSFWHPVKGVHAMKESDPNKRGWAKEKENTRTGMAKG